MNDLQVHEGAEAATTLLRRVEDSNKVCGQRQVYIPVIKAALLMVMLLLDNISSSHLFNAERPLSALLLP